MEIIVNKEEKKVLNEMVEFFEELSVQEQRELEFFVRGYKLARGSEVKKSA